MPTSSNNFYSIALGGCFSFKVQSRVNGLFLNNQDHNTFAKVLEEVFPIIYRRCLPYLIARISIKIDGKFIEKDTILFYSLQRNKRSNLTNLKITQTMSSTTLLALLSQPRIPHWSNQKTSTLPPSMMSSLMSLRFAKKTLESARFCEAI